MIQLKTLAIEARKTSSTASPLHRRIFPFIHASCFLRDFPAFFVGDPLSILVKRLYFFPSCAHIPLHKHKLRFSCFATLFLAGLPINFHQKPLIFPFMCTYSPSYTQVAFVVIAQPFRRGPPISFSQKSSLFPFMSTYSPS